MAVEFACDPYLTHFDPAVVRGGALDEFGILQVFEIKRDVFKKTGLVVLDGEVIMSMTLPDQIVGDVPLSQEGIRSNVFALNIDGIK